MGELTSSEFPGHQTARLRSRAGELTSSEFPGHQTARLRSRAGLLIFLIVCICFNVLSVLATSPGLEGVVLCKRCAVWPGRAVPLHRATYSRGSPCRLHAPSCYGWAAVALVTLVCGIGPPE